VAEHAGADRELVRLLHAADTGHGAPGNTAKLIQGPFLLIAAVEGQVMPDMKDGGIAQFHVMADADLVQ